MKDISRRELLKWIPPVVIAVSLPAHAETSPSKPPTGKPPTTDCIDCEPPAGEPPVSGVCKAGKTLICHKEPHKQDISICVADPAVPAHIRLHGDTIGSCD